MEDMRVKPVQAAEELGMSALTLRCLMQQEKIQIGYCIKHEKRWSYFIYRKLLDQEKRRLGITREDK